MKRRIGLLVLAGLTIGCAGDEPGREVNDTIPRAPEGANLADEGGGGGGGNNPGSPDSIPDDYPGIADFKKANSESAGQEAGEASAVPAEPKAEDDATKVEPPASEEPKVEPPASEEPKVEPPASETPLPEEPKVEPPAEPAPTP